MEQPKSQIAFRNWDSRQRVAHWWCVGAVLVACASPLWGQGKKQFALERKRLVDEAVIGAGVKNRRVIQSMLETPRHEFIPLQKRKQAYIDMALPIGDKQTISSPFIVAYMTESVDPKPTDRVLEIGTGSGYQAAVLSPLVQHVYTIEIVAKLGRRAAATLKRLRYDNVSAKIGDGFKGWSEHAPFDKIIVTCSPEKVPQPLVDQLREGGLMVIPVGERYQQTLFLLTKENGKLKSLALRPTLFVPMTGAAEETRLVKPDPFSPSARNGDFELKPAKNGFIPGWYYQRQLTWESAEDAPHGKHYVTFENEDVGRDAHLLQGFPIDGRRVGSLVASTWVKHDTVHAGRSNTELPALAIRFYDASRRALGTSWIGPFRGSDEWHEASKRIRVPIRARSGILRIGLFGATGSISFDHVQLKPQPR